MRTAARFLIMAVLWSSMSVLATSALAVEAGGVPSLSPNDPSSAELVENPRTWDGERVTFTGEAITEALHRGEMSWIHLNDDAYFLENVEEGAALGGYNSGHAVWIPRRLAERITYFGDHAHEGDVVRVEGEFNAACATHGGDMDIHADSLTVVRVGHEVSEPVKPVKVAVALVLAALAATLWMAGRRATNRELGGFLGR